MKKSLLILLLIATNSYSFSWDGEVTGKVSNLSVVPTNGENFGTRVSLEGSPALCGNEHKWAYINKSDDNSQAGISLLLAAKMSGKTITLYTNQVTSNNYCHIGYISMQ